MYRPEMAGLTFSDLPFVARILNNSYTVEELALPVAIGVALVIISFLARVWQWALFRETIQDGVRRVDLQRPVQNSEAEQLELLFQEMLTAGEHWISAAEALRPGVTSGDERIALAEQEYLRAAQLFQTVLEGTAQRKAEGREGLTYEPAP